MQITTTQKSNFKPTQKISKCMVKNWNFRQKSKFWFKSKISVKIEIWVRNIKINSDKNYAKKWNSDKNWNYGKKWNFDKNWNSDKKIKFW